MCFFNKYVHELVTIDGDSTQLLLVVVDEIAKGVLFLLISHTHSLLVYLCCLGCGIGILLPQLSQ